MVAAALYNAEKAALRPLTDDEQLAVLTREVKQRRESVEAYTKAGRLDLAEREQAEADLIRTFMPEPLDERQVAALVEAAIAETGASSARDLGRVMAVLAPRTRGRADGRDGQRAGGPGACRSRPGRARPRIGRGMIARRVSRAAAFTRRDAVRLVVSVAILAALVTAVLSIDLLPTATFQATVNEPSPVDIYAPRAVQYTSQIQTAAQQQAARAAVAPQYDYTAARGQAFAAQQVAALQNEVAPIDAAFSADLSADARHAALAAALPDLSTASRTTLLDLDATGWTALRGQMITTLEEAQSVEVRDTLLPTARAALGQRLPTSMTDDQRALATEILTPLLVADFELRPGRHDRRPGCRRGGGGARRRPRRQGRAGRAQGRAADARRHRGDRRPRLHRPAGRHVPHRRLVRPRRPGHRHPARLALAVPAGAVASHQHPGPAGPARDRLDGRPRADRDAFDPALLPAARRDRHPHGHPARRRDGHDPDRARRRDGRGGRGLRGRGRRRRAWRLHPPRGPGRDHRRPPR